MGFHELLKIHLSVKHTYYTVQDGRGNTKYTLIHLWGNYQMYSMYKYNLMTERCE